MTQTFQKIVMRITSTSKVYANGKTFNKFGKSQKFSKRVNDEQASTYFLTEADYNLVWQEMKRKTSE